MFFLRFCLFSGIAVTVLPLLDFVEPRFSGLDALAPQLAIGNLLLSLFLLVFRYRIWAAAGILAAVWNGIVLWPAVTFPAPVADASPATDASPAMKVITLNAWFENRDPQKIVDYLTASDADIVGLVEISSSIKAALAPLKAVYPYSIDCVDRDRFCQELLFSKLPLDNAFAGSIGPSLTYVARGDVDWQGRRVGITVAHVALPFIRPDWAPLVAWTRDDAAVPPLPGTPWLRQSRQAAILAQDLDRPGSPADRIVMGDFNSVPWSPLHRAFRTATGLENRGFLVPSWPAWAPFVLRVPIDHVFTGGSLAVLTLRAGPDVGSDHLPVESTIAFTR